MNRRVRGWQGIAVIALAGLTLAACGGEDGDAASDESSTDASAGAAEGDGTLTLGTLLPETGSLAFLGPPEFAGVELAVQEINENGGVLGNDVVKVDSDSGDTETDIATQSTNRLLDQNVDAIIGAASSAVSFNVIDQITAAGVVQFSPANTSPDFTDYDDRDLYFRTAPSDVLQGRVMGDLLVQDGFLDVGLLVLDDPYGTGLAENVTTSLENGGGSVVAEVRYPANNDNFSAQVTEIANAAPEAVVIIGFEETAAVVTEMIAQGLPPGTGDGEIPTYFVDGNLADYSASSDTVLPPGTLEGNKGTLPGAEVSEEFRTRLLETDPDLTSFAYAPESYDAAIVIALAAIAADSDAGTDIAEQIPDVTREGEKCTTFADCVTLLDGGEDIDYDGVSGPIELSDAGDPTQAFIGIYQYDAENKNSPVTYQEGSIEG